MHNQTIDAFKKNSGGPVKTGGPGVGVNDGLAFAMMRSIYKSVRTGRERGSIRFD